jgi:tetratricopeptide (TPR) repeat protein
VKRELDLALADYGRALEIDPGYARAFDGRGDVRMLKGDLDGAIADYGRALAADSSYTTAYVDRGFARAAKGEHAAALADYGVALARQPKWPYYLEGRAWVQLGAHHSDSALADVRRFLDVAGARHAHSHYAVLLGALALRVQNKSDEGVAFLNAWMPQTDTTAWPYPALRYLRHDIDAAMLLALATNDDKMTEAHTYIGVDLAAAGRDAAALPHLQWVRTHGTKTYFEYPLALAELRRLERRAAPAVSRKP